MPHPFSPIFFCTALRSLPSSSQSPLINLYENLDKSYNLPYLDLNGKDIQANIFMVSQQRFRMRPPFPTIWVSTEHLIDGQDLITLRFIPLQLISPHAFHSSKQDMKSTWWVLSCLCTSSPTSLGSFSTSLRGSLITSTGSRRLNLWAAVLPRISGSRLAKRPSISSNSLC